jgi:hypothetical protein
MYMVIAEVAKIRKIETIYLKTTPSGNFDASSRLSPPGLE